MEEMEQAYDDAKYGHWSQRPYIDMIIPTLVDPADGARPASTSSAASSSTRRTSSPRASAPGTTTAEAFGDAVIDRIAEFAPNIRDIIVGRQVLTPLDIERTIGLTEGNIFQGELSPRAAVLQPAGPGLRAVPDADP